MQSWDSWKKNITYFENHYLNLSFLLHVPILLLRCLHPYSQTAIKEATSMPVKFLADSSEITEEDWAYEIVRAGHEGGSVGGGDQEDMTTG